MKREEAIEIIRKNMPSDKSLPVYEALHSLIPELTESEDERIRKEIVSIVQSYRDSCISEGTHRFDDCLAWLEKQKHTAPNEYDEKMRKKIIDHLESIKMGCVICTIDTSKEIAWLEKQKDLTTENIYKHSRERMSFWNGQQKEQKPNSTEDMPYITDEHFYEREPADSFKYKLAEYMTRCCTKKEGPYGYEYGISAESILKMAEEELLKRGVVQKPAEWSEEDERILKGIIGKIDHDQTYGVSKVEMLSFLEDLRPSWKPSEEQMKALNVLNLHGDLSYVGQQNQLISLYNDLKKLM